MLVVFRLYCRTPFGRLYSRNPEIIELAGLIGRTPGAVAMKAVNFANLDPHHRARNVSGLQNSSAADRALWADAQDDWERIALECEVAYQRLQGATGQEAGYEGEPGSAPDGPTEAERTTRVRRVQAFFRATVLAGYEYRCAISGLAVPELLNASHIIPWAANTKRRADPSNGIALNALYDRAFDRGLITIDESFRVVVSSQLDVSDPPDFHRVALLEASHRAMTMPRRFPPDPAALRHHREHVFKP